jgi:DNA-binding transcriptional ArsR family regulator
MRHSSIEQALALLERDEDSEPPDDVAELVAAARAELHDLRLIAGLGAHPIRARILDLMDADRDVAWSPNGLAGALNARLGTVAYHVRTLAGAGAIELSDERRVRGAVEHFYRRAAPARATVAA